MKMSQIARLVISSGMCMVLMVCAVREDKELHIIPDGLVGPVVIIYGVPTCQKVKRSSDGGLVYRIPASGMLCVSNPVPNAGPYRRIYLVESGGGNSHELLHGADSTKLQVFRNISGVTNRIDGKQIDDVRWQAYIVGVPSERSDWFQLLQMKMREAVKEFAPR
jgi:hypothetical protein